MAPHSGSGWNRAPEPLAADVNALPSRYYVPPARSAKERGRGRYAPPWRRPLRWFTTYARIRAAPSDPGEPQVTSASEITELTTARHPSDWTELDSRAVDTARVLAAEAVQLSLIHI